MNKASAAVLGVCLVLGLSIFGGLLGKAAIDFKRQDRSVTVKGLSEQEFEADIVIWPLQFSVPANELQALYSSMQQQEKIITDFLQANGIESDAISVGTPAITDKTANSYNQHDKPAFRFLAVQTVTVYSSQVAAVRKVMVMLSQLGQQGIVLTGAGYEIQPEYIFTRLNEVKPAMIEEATTKAREVAQKFATDSQSRLGKIKRASQGQFSIGERDRNNPHIKRVRVVSTVEFYLAD